MINKESMSKRILILTPNPAHPSHHGRWPYVLEAYREALAGIDAEIFDQPWSEPVTEAFDLIVPLGTFDEDAVVNEADRRFQRFLAEPASLQGDTREAVLTRSAERRVGNECRSRG